MYYSITFILCVRAMAMESHGCVHGTDDDEPVKVHAWDDCPYTPRDTVIRSTLCVVLGSAIPSYYGALAGISLGAVLVLVLALNAMWWSTYLYDFLYNHVCVTYRPCPRHPSLFALSKKAVPAETCVPRTFVVHTNLVNLRRYLNAAIASINKDVRDAAVPDDGPDDDCSSDGVAAAYVKEPGTGIYIVI